VSARHRDDKEAKILRLNYAKAFPAESPVAEWVVAFSIAYQDLQTAGDRAFRRGIRVTPHDFLMYQYDLRLLCGHLVETIELIDSAFKKKALQSFLAGLPEKAKRAKNTIDKHRAWVKNVLEPVRHGSFHYGPNRVREPLAELRTETRLPAPLIIIGGEKPGIHLGYAGDVAYRLLFRHVRGRKDIKSIVQTLREIEDAVGRFAVSLIAHYLTTLPPDAVQDVTG